MEGFFLFREVCLFLSYPPFVKMVKYDGNELPADSLGQ